MISCTPNMLEEHWYSPRTNISTFAPQWDHQHFKHRGQLFFIMSGRLQLRVVVVWLARMASRLCISGNVLGRIISNLEENLMFTFGILFQVLFRRERSKRDTKVSETGLQAGAQACSVVSSCFDESLSLTLHLTSDCWAWMETTPRPQLQTSVTHTLRPSVHSLSLLFAQGHTSTFLIPHYHYLILIRQLHRLHRDCQHGVSTSCRK